MAYLNVVYCNHMDLTWRRPRYNAEVTNGHTIAPYLEIQERQIDAGLHFIREGGKYDLEQTYVLREYLERNPDMFDEVAAMIREGKFTPLGGGESVIDYNLSDSECIVRNHMYSRRWLREKFDYAPTLAACPDTFGLSAGLPGIFRQLGYRGLTFFHRVLVDNKPYWKGLSGDVITLDSARVLQKNVKNISFSSDRKNRVCTVCGGKGCDVCHGMGSEIVIDPPTADVYEQYADLLFETEGDVTFSHNGEECVITEDAVKALEALAAKTGRTLRFVSYEELCNIYAADLLANVDKAAAEDIDARPEGNPMAAGCFTVRIRIKQEIRLCMALMRAAERLSVAAALDGEKYPAKTMEYWWRKMFFLLFHDSIPGSHSDEASVELMEEARRLRVGLGRIIDTTTKKLLKKITVSEGEGIPFVVFNPLEFAVENARMTGVVTCDRLIDGGRVVSADGRECTVIGVHRSGTPDCENAAVEFYGSLPAFGYAVFRFIPAEVETPKPQPVKDGCVMENDFLRVEFGRYSLKRVFDKVKGCDIAVEGTFAPVLTDDAGHLWGRSNRICYTERADMPTHIDNMLPPLAFERKVTYVKGNGFQRVDISVTYIRKERQIKNLEWTAEFMLLDDAPELSVRIHAKFDARDTKLSTQIVLPKAPVNGLLDYEIPLGVLGRGSVEICHELLEYSDEYAALNFVSADLGETRVTLCNNGTAGHSIKDKTIKVSLLRTPTLLCCGYGIEKVIDPTENVFDFTLSSDRDLTNAYRRGMKLNSRFPGVYAAVKDGVLPETGKLFSVPNDAVLIGLKGAEDGNGFVARYLGGAEPVDLKFNAPVTPCSLLEDAEGEATDTICVPRYTVVTCRLGEEAFQK